MTSERLSTVILALVIIQAVFAEDGRPNKRPPPPEIERQTPPPPPSNRPSFPTSPVPPQRASPSCQAALNQSYNRTLGCFSQVALSPNQTFRGQWCSNSGCKGQIRSSISMVLDQCRREDRANNIVGDLSQQFNKIVQFMCQAPDTCPDDADLLANALKQGPATAPLLNSLCQPCALKSLGQETREKMANKTSMPDQQIAHLNRIAQSKSVCDSVDGMYCNPEIMGYNGTQPEKLCSPCFRKYFARMAFTGNTSTESINPFKRFGAILGGGCIHDGNNKPCVKKLANLFNLTAPVLANLSSTTPFTVPTPCSTACDSGCRQFLTNITKAAGTCSSAVKPFIRFLGANVQDSCFDSLNITMPTYAKTVSKLTWVIATNDTATNICNQLTLDLATSFGMDRSKIQCQPKQTIIARRLLSNTQTVTTTSNDYSTDGSSSQSTFTPDTVNGEVVSVSSVPTTTMRASANPQEVSGPTPSSSSAPTSSVHATAPTPSPTSTAYKSSAFQCTQIALIIASIFVL